MEKKQPNQWLAFLLNENYMGKPTTICVLREEVMIHSGTHNNIIRQDHTIYGNKYRGYWEYFSSVARFPRIGWRSFLRPQVMLVTDPRVGNPPEKLMEFMRHNSRCRTGFIHNEIILVAGCGVKLDEMQRKVFLVALPESYRFFIYFCGHICSCIHLARSPEKDIFSLAMRIETLLEDLFFGEVPEDLIEQKYRFKPEQWPEISGAWQGPIDPIIHLINTEPEPMRDAPVDSQRFQFLIHQNFVEVLLEGMKRFTEPDMKRGKWVSAWLANPANPRPKKGG